MTVTRRDNDDDRFMARALALAMRGQGSVEPNPMVGCVIVATARSSARVVTKQFGGPHAEVNALADGRRASGRRDGVRHARALLPSGQDAALHAGADSRRRERAWSLRCRIRFRR